MIAPSPLWSIYIDCDQWKRRRGEARGNRVDREREILGSVEKWESYKSMSILCPRCCSACSPRSAHSLATCLALDWRESSRLERVETWKGGKKECPSKERDAPTLRKVTGREVNKGFFVFFRIAIFRRKVDENTLKSTSKIVIRRYDSSFRFYRLDLARSNAICRFLPCHGRENVLNGESWTSSGRYFFKASIEFIMSFWWQKLVDSDLISSVFHSSSVQMR